MKHLGSDDERSVLAALTAEIGVELTKEQIEALLLHLDLVLAANERFNLTAIRRREDALRLHVVDSLTALTEVTSAPRGELVDIGSGAGFPGIPLGIAGGRDVALIESVGKKARFLAETAESFVGRVRVEVHAMRAEEAAIVQRDRFAVAVARALTALPSLLELACPLVRPGGVVVAMKGPIESRELERGDSAGAILGMERVSARELALPGGDERRCILVYRRSREPEFRLPRPNGTAQSRPLA